MSRRSLAAVLAVSATALACGSDASGDRRGKWQPRASTEWRLLLPPEALAAGPVEVELAAGERAAVFLLNTSGRDGATARIDSSSVAPPATRQAHQASSVALPAVAPGDAGILQATSALGAFLARGPVLRQASSTPARPLARTSFCVLSSSDYRESTRRAGQLVAEGSHALVYVDEAALDDLDAADAARLADAFDRRIHPALTSIFGPPSDVDGNGKVVLFLTTLPQVWGYFWANDTVSPRDLSGGCDGSRSNAIDAVYLTLPSVVTRLGWSRAQALEEILPGVLSHEYAHLLSFQRRCLARRCSGADETWIEEGLAKVAEDEAGYGWNVSRLGGQAYLTRTREDAFRGYDGRSLTVWENDSVGNYEGAHAFIRFHADRLGPGVLAALTSGATGMQNVERALGIAFPEALADVATALLFSNTATSPAETHSFTGAAWTPLSDRLRLLDAVPVGGSLTAAASLRAGGWNAFLTGEAAAGGGTVRVVSGEELPPWVVVVRFRGDL